MYEYDSHFLDYGLTVATRSARVIIPILRDALDSDTRDTRRAALVALADDPAYHTEEVVEALRALADGTSDREEAVTAERVVQRIEAKLEKQ